MSDVSMTSGRRSQLGHSPSELRQRLADAFRPRPLIYWSDMLFSAGLGWFLFVVACQASFGSALHLVASVGAIFALLRAVLFIHELTHLKTGQLRGFETVWNLIVGIPLLVPSLMYVGSHMDHHRRTGFGTLDDPEYAPIASWSRLRLALFVLTVAVIPILLPLRWAVLGPVSRLVPPLRPLVVGKLSTLVINSSYTRPLPRGRHAVRWSWLEAGTCLYAWGVVACFAAGWIPLALFFQWWLVAAGILIVNQVRTLAAHGYENMGEPVDAEGQLLDSINLRGWPIVTALIAPVGLRYHALHHYLPSLPYHSLGTVHRRLIAQLPQDAPYRQTERGPLLGILHRMWDRAATPPDHERLISGIRGATGL
jgi:fatty acid desaturase